MTIFDGIAWVYWLVGTLGLAGTIAAFWFFPVVAMSVAKFLATFLFTTRIGNIVLAAGLAFMIADINRSQRDAADYAEKTAAATQAYEAARKQRDTEITEDTRAAVMAELARARLAEASLNVDVKGFTDALPPAPPVNGTSDFRVGDASCRLRAIAGYAGCGPEAAADGVPQARSKSARARLPAWAQYRLPDVIRRGPREPAHSQ
jgi:hypothetical protein